jgi:hypothetical protein
MAILSGIPGDRGFWEGLIGKMPLLPRPADGGQGQSRSRVTPGKSARTA